jgi:adenine specific DNA methylase Mod
MPVLNWIGKEAVANHDKDVPFKLLRKVKGASVGTSQNLIIHGDNLEALKALMPYYIGQIKCIYIDPPYNTGNENWVYNDKVNSPKIKKWLGKVVGRESEDLSRHDKWLCMMYPRLKLLKDLLREDGVIAVSIGDDEVHDLKYLLDEIFGRNNFEGHIHWRRRHNLPRNWRFRISLVRKYKNRLRD